MHNLIRFILLVSFVTSIAVNPLFTRGEEPASESRVLRVGPLQAPPGTVVTGRVPLGKTLDGTAVELPLILVNGKHPGPVLGLFATMYGKGYEQGIEAVRKLTREAVDPAELRGAIIASPIINPMGFNSRTLFAVEDGVDLQNAFPGNPNGSISRRVAHFLFNDAIKQCNAVINLHAKASIDWSVVMTRDDPKVKKESEALAEAYGTPIFEMSHTAHPNFLIVSAMNIGIPAFISEPVWPPVHGKSVGTSVRGILNVMKHLGMIEGRTEPQTENMVPPGRYRRTFIRAANPGVIQPLKNPGDPMKRGETIAYIRTVLGDIVEEIKSPADGYLRIVAAGRVVQMGGTVGEMFEIKK